MWLLIRVFLFFIISTSAYAAAPVIFYSDLLAGPNTGGQNNNGVFVTIWGNNFGASQGGSTVTVGGGAVSAIETWANGEICFQLGASAATGNIVVTVGGVSSNGLAFTVQSGNIYFVDPTLGSNGSGTYASPYNHIWYAEQVVVAGDTVYIKAGSITNEINGHTGWHTLLMPEAIGTQSHPVSWIAYPGATVTLTATGATATWTAGSSGGTDNVGYIFRANNNDWQTFSKFNLVFTGTSTNLVSPIDGTGGNGWRIVGNNVTASIYTYGNIAFGGNNSSILGNEIHDSVGSSNISTNQNHSIYMDAGADPFEIGWNYTHGNTNSGWEIQSYHTGTRIGPIHDNHIVANNAGDVRGILLGNYDGGDSNPTTVQSNLYYVYNNILVNLGQSGNGGAIQAVTGTAYIYNNTIYGSGTETKGMVQFPSGGIGPGGGAPVWYVANNILYGNQSGLYLSDGNGNAPTWANLTVLAKNDYFGEGNGPTNDTTAINADPKFNANFTDFHLQSSSPDIAVGYNTNSIVANDYDGVARPNPPSVGAYEGSTSCAINGSACSVGSTCCSNLCQSALCVSCLSQAQSCSSNAQCCSNNCVNSVCGVNSGIQDMTFGNVNISGKVYYQ